MILISLPIQIIIMEWIENKYHELQNKINKLKKSLPVERFFEFDGNLQKEYNKITKQYNNCKNLFDNHLDDMNR